MSESGQDGAWSRVARVADLQGGGPFAVSANGIDLVVVDTPDGYRAYAGRCPHQGALLGEGELHGGALVCRNHRWRFDAATGRRMGGPECLTACPLAVRGDALWADTAALGRSSGAAARAASRAARRRVEDLPGPRPWPVVGNLLQLDPSRLHAMLEQWAATYGSPYVFRLGPNRLVAVSDHEVIEAVLRDRPDTYRRTPNVAPVFRELGVDGVFSAEGAAWRPQRRLAMQALSQRDLRGFYPRLAAVADRLARRWAAKADAGAAIDVAEEMKRFTVDVTTALVLGHDVDTIGRDDDAMQRRLGLVFPTFNRRLLALLPTWRWVRMPADRRVDRAMAELRAWLAELVAAARARLATDPARAERPEHFIEAMLVARDAEGRPFSDDAVFGNAMTMLLAGEDTTAYTLAWAVHHLCDAPDAVARLRAESWAAQPPGGVPADIDAAGRLTMAGAVASETMRLRPVAPLVLLAANEDVVIGDVAAPAGTWVALLMRRPAVDARHFAEPLAFRPERWLDDGAPTGAHDAAAAMPFGSGPRICPGRSLALLEMRVALSMLYARFDVERVGDAADVRERFAFTMAPLGLRVRLRRRVPLGATGSGPPAPAAPSTSPASPAAAPSARGRAP